MPAEGGKRAVQGPESATKKARKCPRTGALLDGLAAKTEKWEAEKKVKSEKEAAEKAAGTKTIIAQFVGPEGETLATEFEVPIDSTRKQLEALVGQFRSDEDPTPYSLHVGKEQVEITGSLTEALGKLDTKQKSSETTLMISYFPMSVFTVRAVTRCSSSMPGHTDSVLCCSFSPDSSLCATGSGDTTVRLWDLGTELPHKELKGHKNWVLQVQWSPDASLLASAGLDKIAIIWDPKKGCAVSQLKGHTQPITALCWQPLHLNENPWIATGSKDNQIRVWDPRGMVLKQLSSHTGAVMSLRWGGGGEQNKHGVIYSGSRDRMIKVWDPSDGRMLQDLKGHAHWVNSLALNTEDVIRTGPFEHPYFKDGPVPADRAGRKQRALERYQARVQMCGGERLLSGSDDFTLFLWNPLVQRKPVARMTGHQQVVPFVCFSPDGRFIASASFDKSIRLWDGRTGQYLGVLRGHVAAVYMCSWSADSRLLVTASKDSTVKLWDVSKKKLIEDLPGHADEVYCCDWSRDGAKVVTGSKDRLVKIWRH